MGGGGGSVAQLCLTFATPWTGAHQALLSMGFFKQEYWSRLPFSSPGDLPDPGIEPSSLKSPALAGGFVTTSATWEAPCSTKVKKPLECSSLIIVVTCDKVSSEDCLPISYSVVLMKDDFPFCRFLLSLAVAY